VTSDELPTRERILRAAIRSFQQRGYHGTGLSEILADANAPKGSLYHHFPEGKAQLGVAAIESVAADYEALFAKRRARGVSAANIVRGLAAAQAQWLKDTDWREGGLFSVLAQGFLPDAPDVHRALARAYQRRRELLETALREDGARDVAGVAALALAALDGGMIQAAAVRDSRLLLMAADRAARHLEAECRGEPI
jgi:TetR/AcrR family transcriptional regulator, lmrAB and yxaGH operons repressor